MRSRRTRPGKGPGGRTGRRHGRTSVGWGGDGAGLRGGTGWIGQEGDLSGDGVPGNGAGGAPLLSTCGSKGPAVSTPVGATRTPLHWNDMNGFVFPL